MPFVVVTTRSTTLELSVIDSIAANKLQPTLRIDSVVALDDEMIIPPKAIHRERIDALQHNGLTIHIHITALDANVERVVLRGAGDFGIRQRRREHEPILE